MLVLTAAVQDFVADDDEVKSIHDEVYLIRPSEHSDGLIADNVFHL